MRMRFHRQQTVAVALWLCSTIALAGPNGEELCLAIGDQAFRIADARDKVGLEEASALKLFEADTDVTTRTLNERVARWVYTMREKPAKSRQLAYLKCKTGDFTKNLPTGSREQKRPQG